MLTTVAPLADLRAARANRVFRTDKNNPYQNTVMDNTKNGLGLSLSKIEDTRGRLFVRAKSELCNNGGRDLSRHV